MCWNFTASIVFTTVGLLASLFLIRKKDDPMLWIPLIYFSLMELLQVITYLYLNQCDLPMNQMLTYIGYLHIAFQPFFMNMIWLHFIPIKVKKKIQWYVYTVAFVATILMLIKVYPFAFAETCRAGTDFLCGQSLCSVSGKWHMAWMLPLNNLGNFGTFAYLFAALGLPFIYGSWKVNLYQILLGPGIVALVSQDLNESPAVWCLFSIAIFMLAFIPKLRASLHVEKWYFWKYPKFLTK